LENFVRASVGKLGLLRKSLLTGIVFTAAGIVELVLVSILNLGVILSCTRTFCSAFDPSYLQVGFGLVALGLVFLIIWVLTW